MGGEDRRGRKCEGKGREAEMKTKLNLIERQECSRKRRGECIVRREVKTLRTWWWLRKE